MKTLLSIIYFTIALFFALFASRCNLERSELVRDPNLTIECKVAIDALYYNQKQTDKTAIVEAIRACKESNRYVRCIQYIENRTLFAECKELLK